MGIIFNDGDGDQYYPGAILLNKSPQDMLDMAMQGVKHDQGKADWSLVHLKTIEQFVQVLTFGAEKYTRDGWKTVEPHRVRAALMRHLAKRDDGQMRDEESGLLEMAHVMCNAYFLLYWDYMNARAKSQGD